MNETPQPVDALVDETERLSLYQDSRLPENYVLTKDTWQPALVEAPVLDPDFAAAGVADPKLVDYLRSLDDAEQPDSGISEKAFLAWLETDPLALAIVAGDSEAILRHAEGQPDYIKERLAAYATSGKIPPQDPAALRNAARRLAIKQAKQRRFVVDRTYTTKGD